MAHRNRLAGESSPYLQQHADNPVEWYPWGPEALERARRENRPILLSIGYSACHWCHVMAHESFEDDATAAVMNARYINIKVDREERPDLDKIYQTAHQLLTRRPGGWPLTVFLTPDQTPFFAGTYFPPQPRHGLPAFKEILERVGDFLAEHPEQIAEQNHSLVAALSRVDATERLAGVVDDKPLQRMSEQAAALYDRQHGGFGGAPKFPHSANLELLLHSSNPDDREAALDSLRKMAAGGLFDQIGGGFFRYSVDERWEIPHFEKMLYDNGPLLKLYAEAWRITGETRFREVAELTAQWAMREMQSPDGGYFASLDADSPGGEGAFYLWDPDSLGRLLDDTDCRLAALAWGLDGPANFEGRWHLQRRAPMTLLVEQTGQPETQIRERLERIRQRLADARSERPAPGRDEKVLTAWNGMMITGMAEAGRLLQRPEYVASARRAFGFVQQRLWDGRLKAVFKDGEARLSGYLDDHAWMIEAALALFGAEQAWNDLPWAQELGELLLEHFEDEQSGGFFFTADDHERLIYRPKPLTDEAYPAGNGIAAHALLRLSHVMGDLHLADAAERTLRAAHDTMNEYPTGSGSLMLALAEYLEPTDLVVLRGDPPSADWWGVFARPPFRRHQVVFAPRSAASLPDVLDKGPVPNQGTRAWLCRGTRCLPPVDSAEALGKLLESA